MADVNRGNRPLSPHLTIYRPQMTSISSIFVRITGNALLTATLLLIAWLLAASTSAAAFEWVQCVRDHKLVWRSGVSSVPLGALVPHAWRVAPFDLGHRPRVGVENRRAYGLDDDHRVASAHSFHSNMAIRRSQHGFFD